MVARGERPLYRGLVVNPIASSLSGCSFSKSGTTTLGYFKNKWSWGGLTPQKDRDRGVALVIATKGNNGWPTYGLSWNFAEH
jgi:hypothetical protein